MKNYSIVRVGNEYIVQADEKSILKVSSRRKAVRLVSYAAELLESEPAPPLVPEANAESCDAGGTPEAGATPDPTGIPDPSEVS
jgi:hypothetical protein